MRPSYNNLKPITTLSGIAPDMVCYGAAISACSEAGLPEEALDVMQRMTAAGFIPDKMAFNAVIAAFGHNGEWEQALDTLGEMRAAGLRPNQHSYRLAMEVRELLSAFLRRFREKGYEDKPLPSLVS